MTTRYRGAGYAGVIGTLLILFSLLSSVWGINDPTLNFFWWVSHAVIWGCALAFCVAMGFRLNKEVTLKNDMAAACIGIVSGGFTIGINLLVGIIDPALSYVSSESVWLVMLAPVSETLLFNVAVYEVFDFHLRGVDWLQVAIASDIAFVGYHYFKYFMQTQTLAPIFIMLILTVGNTLFVYTYHVTKNATAPMVAHTVVNFASQRQQVIQTFIDAVPALVSLFVLVVIAYFVSKIIRRNI
jgi:hypothetical protein